MTNSDKKQMKSVIKPLIKECLTEILMEQGLISLVKEHVSTESRPVVGKQVETTTFLAENGQNKKKIDYSKVFKKEAVEKNKKFGFDMESSGFNPFQGTVPSQEKENTPTPQQKMVGNLINESSGEWSRILDAMKARK